MCAPAKPPQRERKGAGEERTGGGEGGEGAGKAKRSVESGGVAATMGARKKKTNKTPKQRARKHRSQQGEKET